MKRHITSFMFWAILPRNSSLISHLKATQTLSSNSRVEGSKRGNTGDILIDRLFALFKSLPLPHISKRPKCYLCDLFCVTLRLTILAI